MNALILHGTDNNHAGNWFPWLKSELEKMGLEVWVPDLPDAQLPNIKTYNRFLLGGDWEFNDSLMVGHSSGSVAILGLLQKLPEDVSIDTAILVGTFHTMDQENRAGLNIDYDYEKIQKKARQFIVVHSDNDPYCPLEEAEWVAEKLDAELILFPGYQHFGMTQDPKFKKFPELLEIIKQKVL